LFSIIAASDALSYELRELHHEGNEDKKSKGVHLPFIVN
jgi:hypothetical protein